MSENTRDAVRAIADAPPHRRTAMINDFISDRMTLFKQISRWLCRNFGQSYENHGEDFASMVSMEAFKMLSEQISDEEQLERVEVWEGMLRVRSRQIIRNFLDKEMAPAADMSPTLRRVRLLNQTRDEMARETGRFPTDAEVVEAHNTKMRAQRVNPVKQGVIATVEDLQVFRQCADVQDHDYSAPIDTDFVLHPVEGPRFIELLVARTTAYNERLGEAARLWLSGLYAEGEPPKIATVEEIADALGVSQSTARAYVRKIKDYAITVAREEFDIGQDDL
ncbi:MAG TPA: hypothetical protein VF885_21995 [Arthrobacter sp.]